MAGRARHRMRTAVRRLNLEQPRSTFGPPPGFQFVIAGGQQVTAGGDNVVVPL